MKRVLFLGVSLISLSMAKAQQEGHIFRPFKVDVSTGYAIAEGSGSKGGALFVIEPKYAVIDQLSIGLRLEAAVTARGLSTANNSGSNVDANVSADVSYLLTGDYYFSNNDFRPFAGVGVGFFTLASATVNANSSQGSSTVTTSPATTAFGGMVRVGFEARHFRLGVEYNIVGQTNATQTNGTTTTTVTAKNGYVGLKLGVCIGGGRYKR